MRLVAISSVKNEADLAELWCRHHARLFEHLYITDDSDADATGEILARLAAEGLPVTRWTSGETAFSYRQAAVMNRAIRRVLAEDAADWIFPLDADEFVQADRAQIEASLPLVPPRCCAAHIWATYVPVAEYGDSRNPLHDCFRRRNPEGAACAKAIVPRALAETCRVSTGSHVLHFPNGAFVPGVEMPWKLAHTPVRNADQWVARSLPSCSKVFGPGQQEQCGGWFQDGWLHAWNFAPTLAQIHDVAMIRICYPDHAKPTGVDERDRVIAADIRQRWPDLAKIDPFRVIERHTEDLRAAIAELGGESEAVDVAAIRGSQTKPEALRALEAHCEKLSRQRWVLMALPGCEELVSQIVSLGGVPPRKPSSIAGPPRREMWETELWRVLAEYESKLSEALVELRGGEA